MGRTQQVDYAEVDQVVSLPVKKQIWDGEQFVSMTLYKHFLPYGIRWAWPNKNRWTWLEQTYGPAGTYVKGRYWDYSHAGNFFVMDEQIYTWFQIKWGNE